MTTALDLLRAEPGIDAAFVLEFEGIETAFCSTPDTAGIAAAWAATSWTDFRPVLERPGAVSREMNLLSPQMDPADLQVSLIEDEAGTLVALFADADTSAASTTTTETINRTATTIPTRNAGALSAFNVAYLGHERITYTALPSTGVVRGTFATFGKTSWAHTHRISPEGLGVEVRSKPRIWKNRGATVYLVVRDPSTGTWTTRADAHIWFAGFIKRIGRQVDDGHWTIDMASVEEAARAQLLRDQFAGKIREGFDVEVADVTGLRVTETREVPTVHLKSTTISLTPGHYTIHTLLIALNDALETARAAGALGFFWNFGIATGTDGNQRVKWSVHDPDNTVNGDTPYIIEFFATARLRDILGGFTAVLDDDRSARVFVTGEQTLIQLSPLAPVQTEWFPDIGSIQVESRRGTWAFPSDYADFPAWLNMSGTARPGVLQIGEKNPVLWAVDFDGTDTFTRKGTMTVTGKRAGAQVFVRQVVRVGEEKDLQVRQVWYSEGRLDTILAKMFLSTGTAGYNDATYDKWPDQVSFGIPSTLVDVASFQALRVALGPAARNVRCILLEPMSGEAVLNSLQGLYAAHVLWRAGKIAAVLPSLIAGLPAQWTIDRDVQTEHAQMDDGAELIQNRLVLKYNRDPIEDKYTREETYDNLPSQSEHGISDAFLLEALWLYDDDGSKIQSWRENVAGPMLAYFGRAIRRYRVPCTRGVIAVSLGDIVEWTADDAPDAQLGVYGVTAAKAWVVGVENDPETLGVVLTLLRPTGRNFALGPSAMLDYNRGDKGYEAAGPYLHVLDHEFTYASAAVDASHFAVGEAIRIIEVDPVDAAVPVLWSRTVSAVTASRITIDSVLSAPAFDTTKRYYVEFADSHGFGVVQAQLDEHSFIADDIDDRVPDDSPPNIWGIFLPDVLTATPSGQNRFRRPPDLQGMAGSPLSVHAERDLAENLNNLYQHVTNQDPIADLFVGERTTTATAYESLVTPVMVYCPPGVETLELEVFCRVTDDAALGGTPTADYRITCTPEFPRGPLTAVEFGVDVRQATTQITDTTQVRKTMTVLVIPGADRRCYVTIEARAVGAAYTARLGGWGGYFGARPLV